jgi:cation diffusion facilitator CzcD-associated flavoprotein CzcO
MLTYRLTGTTEDPGSTTTNPSSIRPAIPARNQQRGAESSHPMVRHGAASLTCDFLYSCAGYYDYDRPHAPALPGLEDFTGEFVLPQFWPERLDYAGKKVVVIGSGATAVTLVPVMASGEGAASHVTMLQRSPTWIAAVPGRDTVADRLREKLPPRLAHRLIRTKNVLFNIGCYQFCQRRPALARRMILGLTAKALGPEMVAEHFTPSYKPWDQRFCAIPDADLFRAIRGGRADVVTDHVDRFVPQGVRLRPGRVLEADVVVSATGLRLLALGGIAPSVRRHTGRPGRAVRAARRDGHRTAQLRGLHRLHQRLVDVAGRPEQPAHVQGARVHGPPRVRRGGAPAGPRL